MTSPHTRSRSGALGLAVSALVASTASATDVLTLPLADVRNGNDLGPVWSGIDSAPQFGIPWGDAIVNLPGCVAISGFKLSSGFGPQQAVWIWRPPLSSDPLARYGMVHTETLLPLPASGAVGPAAGFGTSLAGNAHWLFVGAPNTKVDGVTNGGAVHVFRRENIDDPWSAFGVMSSQQPELDALYGGSLAFDGTTLVVGVPFRQANSRSLNTGGADLFTVTDTSIGSPRSFTAPFIGGASMQIGRRAAVGGAHFALSDPNVFELGPSGLVFVVSTGQDLAIEAMLPTPSGQIQTLFGDSISLANERLAIGAPQEDADGKPNAGVVRVYEFDGTSWNVSDTLVGATPSAQLGQVVLDGDLLSVGAPTTQVQFGGPSLPGGECSLYRIDASGRTILASAKYYDHQGVEVHAQIGQRVTLGSGRWSFTEAIWAAADNERSVRSLPLSAAFSDCDGDGVADLAEVLNGAPDRDSDGVPDDCVGPRVVDCDGDGIVDTASTLFAPSISPLVPGSGWWANLSAPSDTNRALMWLVPLEVPLGTDGVLRGVETDWQAIDRPQPVIVAIYNDPNQDGNPSDVVLHAAYRAAVAATSGVDRVFFEPISIGPPGTKYFVGLGTLALQGVSATMGLRAEVSTSPWTPHSWVTYGASLLAANFNVEHPNENATFQLFTQAPTMVGVGLFNNPIDANGNAIPDSCECTADLDGDGDVSASDLAILIGAWGTSGPGDLDGDGAVGSADLALLLGMWGTC